MLQGENLNTLPTCFILSTRFSPQHQSCPASKNPSEQPCFGFDDEVLFYRTNLRQICLRQTDITSLGERFQTFPDLNDCSFNKSGVENKHLLAIFFSNQIYFAYLKRIF